MRGDTVIYRPTGVSARIALGTWASTHMAPEVFDEKEFPGCGLAEWKDWPCESAEMVEISDSE
ncbi:hypothetical protein ANO11243_075300 [Dothideomycetidae sp. 11243]|nr:hypothetical protein ANO11243_075300 [fungal sp. No.11243]